MDGQKSRDPLNELAAVIRAEKHPELDLARIEARLVAQFEAARARGELRPKARLHAAGRLAPWLAVAALLVLGVGLARVLGLGRHWTSVSGDVLPGDRGGIVIARSIDGEALVVGASVVAEPGQVVRVEHAQRAMWELAAGSGAHLTDVGSGVLCVELERGALSAVVTPSRAESFIVRARGTEVAVHGTRFRVEMDGERVVVSVSEGEVEVRPLERTSRSRLTVGMRAAFVAGVPQGGALAAPALTAPAAGDRSPESGAPGAAASGSAAIDRRALGAPSPDSSSGAARKSGTEPAQRRSSAVARRSDPAPGVEPLAEPAAAAEVPAAVADAAIARVSEHIQGCFRRHTSGSGAVSIEAATHVSLEVQPSGLILGVSLDPPLAPQVEACVASELATVNLGTSEAGYRVRREIRLSP